MTRFSRQRLTTGLSTVLDVAAIALFFVQSAVGDADWIKDEFLDYQFWTSVSDLGVRHRLPAMQWSATNGKCYLTWYFFVFALG